MTHSSILSIVAISLIAAPALAAQRTFVSTGGSDGNPCSIASPCRSFGTAITHTDPGGEVIVLDSGGYGTATISQSVSIIAPAGVYAGVSVFSGDDGVTITAAASDEVVLNGLTINGQGGNRGIVVTTAGKVSIENCAISGMHASGIQVDSANKLYISHATVRANASSGLFLTTNSGAEVHINDSTFRGNTGAGITQRSGTLTAARISANDNGTDGILVAPLAIKLVTAALADSTFSGNVGNGVLGVTGASAATVRVSVSRSASMRNGASGYTASTSSSPGTVFLTVSESASFDNGGRGLLATGGNTIAVVSNSTLAANSLADLHQAAFSELRTSANNTLTGRGAGDVSGTLTANPLQ